MQIKMLLAFIQSGSYKTTTLGIFGLLAAVVFVAVTIFIENSTEKYPVLEQIKGFLPAAMLIFPSLAAIFARDNDKTSEDVGAKKAANEDDK